MAPVKRLYSFRNLGTVMVSKLDKAKDVAMKDPLVKATQAIAGMLAPEVIVTLKPSDKPSVLND